MIALVFNIFWDLFRLYNQNWPVLGSLQASITFFSWNPPFGEDFPSPDDGLPFKSLTLACNEVEEPPITASSAGSWEEGIPRSFIQNQSLVQQMCGGNGARPHISPPTTAPTNNKTQQTMNYWVLSHRLENTTNQTLTEPSKKLAFPSIWNCLCS